MNIIFLYLLIFVSVVITGCFPQTTIPIRPSYEEIQSYDIGELPKNYEQLVINYSAPLFKDPSSRQFDFTGEPYKESILINNHYGIYWVGEVLINAKNSFGGYNGFKRYGYAIRFGEVELFNKLN